MTSLRARLSTFLLLSAVLVAVVIGLIAYRQTLQQNEAFFDYQLRQTALSLRDQGVAERWQPYRYGEDVLDVVVKIWTINGTVLYLSHPDTVMPDRATLGFNDVEAAGRRWRVYSMAARNRVIQVAQPLELRRDLAAAAALRSLSPLLAFAPLMALLAWWLITRELHPLKRLEREVKRRDARSLDAVSEVGLPSEIAPVVQALNSLLARLQRAFASQRAFVGDAAHELRSPLAALKLQLQVLEKAKNDGDRRTALNHLHDGVDRASRLIEQLLTAARTEPGESVVAMAPVNLAETLRRVIADAFDSATERNIEMALEAPDDVTVDGNSEQLRILMRNLVDNAIRYTPVDGQVLVTVDAGPEATTLVIEDSGPGIPGPERERVFQRFYRGQSNGPTGSGLGLAIAMNIATQHRATIRLRNSSLGGLGVEVRFPPVATA
jgi:signal transduction histidine kinase